MIRTPSKSRSMTHPARTVACELHLATTSTEQWLISALEVSLDSP